MLDVAATVLLAPLLVAAATLTGRRLGPHAGGLVSAFPAIVGPVLVIDLLAHGAAFTADAATGTLLGIAALAAFAAAYARLADGHAWPRALAGAWLAAALAGAALAAVRTGPLVAAAVAAAALAAAALVIGRGAAPLPARAAGSVGMRMAASAALVVALAAAAGAVGPTAGGILAALPALASVLAVFTHRDEGAAAAVALLRGMVAGMGGFALFCLTVALLVERVAPAVAFAAAALGALGAQAAAAYADVSTSSRSPAA